MNKTRAEQFFNEVKPSVVKRYADYWESIKPVTTDDFFRRYLFAFTSVHTSWQGNINGYLAIRDLGWMNDKEDLLQRLIGAKCGMFNVRTATIWKFKEQFYSHPEKFCNVEGSWQNYRNKIVNEISGLGIAKVSFTLEMCFPNEAQVSCIDTHGIQLYEIKEKSFMTRKGMGVYHDAENHWLDCSREVKGSSTITRAIYWDKKQNKPDSTYWTYVLEDKNGRDFTRVKY